MKISSETGRGGLWGGGPLVGGFGNCPGGESSASSASLGSGHCGDKPLAAPLLSGGVSVCSGRAACWELNEATFWFGLWGRPIIFDRSGFGGCVFEACIRSRAARTEPLVAGESSSSSGEPYGQAATRGLELMNGSDEWWWWFVSGDRHGSTLRWVIEKSRRTRELMTATQAGAAHVGAVSGSAAGRGKLGPFGSSDHKT